MKSFNQQRLTENESTSKKMERKFTSAMQKASQIENIMNKGKEQQQQGLKQQSQAFTEQGTITDVTVCKRELISTNVGSPPLASSLSWPDGSVVEKRRLDVANSVEVMESSRAKSQYVNPEEYQFFINAIEKLKATNLFHEEDIKCMSDEQIYDALVEHARKQKLKQRLMVAHQLSMSTAAGSSSLAYSAQACGESIDGKEDDDDLPIIMKNLHSVKSLKHFFEIRAKSTAAAMSAISQQFTNNDSSNNSNSEHCASNVNSPQLNQRSTKNRTELAVTVSSQTSTAPAVMSAPSHDIFMKSSNYLIEKSIKHGIGLANKVTFFIHVLAFFLQVCSKLQ